MDERHVLAAARDVERNPVRARLCARTQDWPWSSAGAHFAGRDDDLVAVQPLLELAPDWGAFIGEGEDEGINERLRGHASTGRSLGSVAFVESLERRLARSLKRKKPGPKRQERDVDTVDLFDEGGGVTLTVPGIRRSSLLADPDVFNTVSPVSTDGNPGKAPSLRLYGNGLARQRLRC